MNGLGETKARASIGVKVGIVLSAVVVVGTYAALFIPAIVGQKPQQMSMLPALFGTALFLMFCWKGRGRRGAWGFLCGIVVGSLVLVAAGATARVQELNARAEQVSAKLDELNRGLPRIVEEGTRLDRIEIDGDRIIYRLTLVDLTADEIDRDSMKELTQQAIATNLCADEAKRKSVKAGVTFLYTYRDRKDAPIAEIVIGEADCS